MCEMDTALIDWADMYGRRDPQRTLLSLISHAAGGSPSAAGSQPAGGLGQPITWVLDGREMTIRHSAT